MASFVVFSPAYTQNTVNDCMAIYSVHFIIRCHVYACYGERLAFMNPQIEF